MRRCVIATNLTIESPNLDRITTEAGQFTADAISTLWAALNDTRASLRRNFRRASSTIAPDLLTLTAAASVNNLDITGKSFVSFIGAAAENFTGMRAPETGESRVVLIEVSGAGTITVKNTATSETANQFALSGGVDYAMSTGKGLIVAYIASKWREVARSG